MGPEAVPQIHGIQGASLRTAANLDSPLQLLLFCFCPQSFGDLSHRPLLVDLTIEDQSRLKVIYGSAEGFHAVDLDSATVYDVYLPKHVRVVTAAIANCIRSN